jgi:hypothetical protein
MEQRLVCPCRQYVASSVHCCPSAAAAAAAATSGQLPLSCHIPSRQWWEGKGRVSSGQGWCVHAGSMCISCPLLPLPKQPPPLLPLPLPLLLQPPLPPPLLQLLQTHVMGGKTGIIG